ncbi:AbfB domain-containing protein [Streptomyces resistomycificus]|uniref:Alpha-L-arabinofuranosidase n=1 Tax=Streptomyces resistomycificus TaxID=67356 RepID=A0A0L8LYQ6_9ACTN|nr:AbfB domain-containing protein [Streptomyces resistomycificus]KOG43322.1 alpha-L-arabinofuranosidase [Streptomyces resistomycificus]KUN91721.1 alpha-L-arabinofuranosidase [Streptomyces resistomycificus]
MPKSKSRPPQHQPWESGWSPDATRVPGTRRLWLAGALAIATVAACVTAITVTEQQPGDPSPKKDQAGAAVPSGPGLISYPTPAPSDGSPPATKRSSPSARTTTSAPEPQGSASVTRPADPPKSPSTQPGSANPKPPATTWRSVRSVNYPDRYWHVSGGAVRLDPVRGSESREDSTFKLVKGLADSSCYSFATADGGYLRHRQFVLRAEHDDGSALFEQDATFCARTASSPGAVMLESVNYPGRFLRHENFQLRLQPYQHSGLYQADSSFRLVGGLA